MDGQPNQGKEFNWGKFKIAFCLSILDSLLATLLYALPLIAATGYPPKAAIMFSILVGSLAFFIASLYSKMKTPMETIIEQCNDDLTRPPRQGDITITSRIHETPAPVEQPPKLSVMTRIQVCTHRKMLAAKPLLSLFSGFLI